MTETVLHLVESESRSRADFARIALSMGHHCEVYANLDELCAHRPERGILIIRDAAEPGGFAAAIETTGQSGIWLPIVATGPHPTTSQVVSAIQAGASDYVESPLTAERLSLMLERIGQEAEDAATTRRSAINARTRLERLTRRERDVLELLVQGNSNKEIARTLELSPRTVEINRANMMAKLGASHSAEVIRLRLEAGLVSAASTRDLRTG